MLLESILRGRCAAFLAPNSVTLYPACGLGWGEALGCSPLWLFHFTLFCVVFSPSPGVGDLFCCLHVVFMFSCICCIFFVFLGKGFCLAFLLHHLFLCPLTSFFFEIRCFPYENMNIFFRKCLSI